MLLEMARADLELQLILTRAIKHNLRVDEIEAGRAKIESVIRQLSERDRRFVREGLRQSSSVGAKRYVTEVLTGT
jgi:hypothetical protein